MTESEPWTNINDSENLNFARLTWHCFKKGIQVGAVIGCAVVAPFTIMKGMKSGQGILWNQIVQRQLYSFAFGSVLSLGMMMGKYQGWQNKKLCLQDRTYRIGMN